MVFANVAVCILIQRHRFCNDLYKKITIAGEALARKSGPKTGTAHLTLINGRKGAKSRQKINLMIPIVPDKPRFKRLNNQR